MRKSWDNYFMDIAHMVATRATCPKRHVGALLVHDKLILGTGYNGAKSGEPHCDDVGCDLDAEDKCIRTIHAEINAISHTEFYTLEGTTMYTTDFPCIDCAKAIVRFNIARVVYEKPYLRTKDAVLKLFKENDIIVEKISSIPT